MKVLRTAAREIAHLQFSTDGTTLLVFEGWSVPRSRTRWGTDDLDAVFRVRLSSGEEIQRAYLPRQTYTVCPLTERVAFAVDYWQPLRTHVEVFDPWEGKLHASFPVNRTPSGLLFTPDGKKLVLIGCHGWIDVETGLRDEMNAAADWACVSPCSRYVAFGHHLYPVSIWQSAKKVTDCNICAEGGMAWSSSGWMAWLRGNYVHIGHFGRGELGEADGFEVDETDELPILAFHPAGDVLFAGGSDGSVRLWNPANRRLLREYAWGIGPITAVAFSRDGLTCAAGGEKGQVVVWDVDV